MRSVRTRASTASYISRTSRKPSKQAWPSGVSTNGRFVAIDQLHAEMLLDAMDRLGGRRLADFVQDRPAGEALMLDDIAEDADGLDVHKDILSLDSLIIKRFGCRWGEVCRAGWAGWREVRRMPNLAWIWAGGCLMMSGVFLAVGGC